jgi:hypothetical protein
LGRDKNIIVKRDYLKDLHDKKIIGGNIKETIAWNISVRNNKNSKIDVCIYDQLPISERKSIEIEKIELSNAQVEDKTGKLKWNFQLESGIKHEIKYTYSIKYPKELFIEEF